MCRIPLVLSLLVAMGLPWTSPLAQEPPRFVIQTIAGERKAGFDGDGGPATAAHLDHPTAVAADSKGNVYIADFKNERVRRVTPDGQIDTVMGSGERTPEKNDLVAPLDLNLALPYGIAVDGKDRLYVLIRGHHTIYRVNADGQAERFAGSWRAGYSGDGGSALDAELRQPNHLCSGPNGTIYIADSANFRVRAVGADGVIKTVAGTGELGFSGDGGPALAAQIGGLSAIASDSLGNLYLADFSNHRIRKVDTEGIITTIAGTGEKKYNGDEIPAVEANVGEPTGVVADDSGVVYISDQINNRIRAVTPDGIIHTVAGTGKIGLTGDGGPATEANIFIPDILCLMPNGDIVIPDHQNNAVRRLVRLD